jgi:DNA-binding MarR family transcriptional regulator
VQSTLSPSSSALASRLRLAIARTARRLRQEVGAELSPSMSSALATIDRHGPLTPSELATRERIQRPTVTRVLARLEEQALVVRTADAHDGRSCLIAVSPAGHARMEELRTRKDAYLARRLDELTAEDRAVLDRAAGILEQLLEEDAPE